MLELREATYRLIYQVEGHYSYRKLRQLAAAAGGRRWSAQEVLEYWVSPATMPPALCLRIARWIWESEREAEDAWVRTVANRSALLRTWRPSMSEARDECCRRELLGRAAAVLRSDQRWREATIAPELSFDKLYDDGGTTTILEDDVARAIEALLATPRWSALRRDFGRLYWVRAGAPRSWSAQEWIESAVDDLLAFAERLEGRPDDEERQAAQALDDIYDRWESIYQPWLAAIDLPGEVTLADDCADGSGGPRADNNEREVKGSGDLRFDFGALVDELMSVWNVGLDPATRRALRQRAANAHVDTSEVKRQALEIGVRLAYEQRGEEWTPRIDSRKPPIVPSRDLDEHGFRHWHRRESMKAAGRWLLDRPYPPSRGTAEDLRPTHELESLHVVSTEPRKSGAIAIQAGEADADGEGGEIQQEMAAEVLAELLTLASPAERRTVETYLALDKPTWAQVDATISRAPGESRQLWKRLKDKHIRSQRGGATP